MTEIGSRLCVPCWRFFSEHVCAENSPEHALKRLSEWGDTVGRGDMPLMKMLIMVKIDHPHCKFCFSEDVTTVTADNRNALMASLPAL
jgi:hypothetical protein